MKYTVNMMSDQADKIKKLVAFKKKIENKIDELKSELEDLQTMLETVNIILLDKGFKHAEITKTPAMTETSPKEVEAAAEAKPSYPTPTAEYGNIIPLKTFTGELLANLHQNTDSLRVVLAEDKNFSSNTPPFTQFLIERVLEKMKEKDEKLTRSGQLMPDKVFSYNIVKDGEKIREIAIENVDTNRLRELKSSIRWTLEKMYEKTESQS